MINQFEKIIIVEAGFNSIKVEDFLRKKHLFSKRLITKLKNTPNGIMVNGKHSRTIDTLKTGDKITLTLPEEISQKVENLPRCIKSISQDGNTICLANGYELYIKYEDEDVVVIDKPYNMPVHPSRGHQQNTLYHIFHEYYYNVGNKNYTFRAINRLDRDTTGLVVIAKNQYTATIIGSSIQKMYYAVIKGELSEESGSIELPIGRVSQGGISRCVRPDGEYALTNYKVDCVCTQYSGVEVVLPTGRTHQIRVHFAHIGYPLVGDSMYGGDLSVMTRQALHCKTVTFNKSEKEKVTVTSELPFDMQQLLK